MSISKAVVAVAFAVNLLTAGNAVAGFECGEPGQPACPVPNPSSAALVASGVAALAGLGWWIRRK